MTKPVRRAKVPWPEEKQEDVTLIWKKKRVYSYSDEGLQEECQMKTAKTLLVMAEAPEEGWEEDLEEAGGATGADRD